MKRKVESTRIIIIFSTAFIVFMVGAGALFGLQLENSTPKPQPSDAPTVINVSNSTEVIITPNYAFEYDHETWGFVDRGNGYDVKIRNLETGNILTIISKENLSSLDEVETQEKNSFTKIFKEFTIIEEDNIKLAGVNFYKYSMEYNLNSGRNLSHQLRYISIVDGNVIKFVYSGSDFSEEEIENLEEFIDSINF